MLIRNEFLVEAPTLFTILFYENSGDMSQLDEVAVLQYDAFCAGDCSVRYVRS